MRPNNELQYHGSSKVIFKLRLVHQPKCYEIKLQEIDQYNDELIYPPFKDLSLATVSYNRIIRRLLDTGMYEILDEVLGFGNNRACSLRFKELFIWSHPYDN